MSNKRARFGNALEKMIWGIKTVGIFRVMRGLVRYARYRVVRPESVQIHLSRINAQLKFNYPSQLVPALVLFGDLIDPEYAFLQAAARPSWTFLDVGAAIGRLARAPHRHGAHRRDLHRKHSLGLSELTKWSGRSKPARIPDAHAMTKIERYFRIVPIAFDEIAARSRGVRR